MKIHHIALWTKDLDEAAQFWATHFGAVIGPRYVSANRIGFESHFLTLQDGAQIELMTGPWLSNSESTNLQPESVGWAHVAITVGSEGRVRSIAADLDKKGLLVSHPRMTGDGYYEAQVQTPDGILVEIVA